MDIISHPKTINVHTVTLDDDEIWEILGNPEALLDQLRERAMNTDGQSTLIHAVRKTKRVKSGKKKNTRKSGGVRPSVKCPHCDRHIAEFMLARHIATSHPDQA